MSDKKSSSSLFKIGLSAVVALLLFYFGFNFLKGINLFDRTQSYYVTFENSKDITISTPVLLDGYKVGLVRNISFDYEHLRGITVEMALEKELKIPRGSRVAVRGNPLSGAELAIIKSERGHSGFFSPGDTLNNYSNNDLVTQVSEEIIPNLVTLMKKVDSVMIGLDKIINNGHILQTFEDISAVSSNLRLSTEKVQSLMNKEIPGIVKSVEESTSSIHTITQEVSQANITKSVKDLETTLQNIQMLTQRFTASDNSMGLLLNDKELYNNLAQTASAADSLLTDIRKNPKRYVTFSLF